jgi:DNA-binding response OmpR family regulator
MAFTGSVLVIDDEPTLRQTLTRILRQAGCEVTAAADGSEALQRLTTSSYDLAYLDIHLPGMDGLEVLKQIQQRYPQLPVILFTAHASLESAVEAIRLGATDYLIKPIDPETLLSRTRVVLEEKAFERRRREIERQIESLQGELKTLTQPAAPPKPAGTAPLSGDRFLKRGKLILDLQARRATFGDKVLGLPPAAFDYLVVLTRHSPDIVEYQPLVAEAQGYQTDRREAQELAKWHIHELRESLEPDPREPRFVLNVRGIGYRLVAD